MGYLSCLCRVWGGGTFGTFLARLAVSGLCRVPDSWRTNWFKQLVFFRSCADSADVAEQFPKEFSGSARSLGRQPDGVDWVMRARSQVALCVKPLEAIIVESRVGLNAGLARQFVKDAEAQHGKDSLIEFLGGYSNGFHGHERNSQRGRSTRAA